MRGTIDGKHEAEYRKGAGTNESRPPGAEFERFELTRNWSLILMFLVMPFALVLLLFIGTCYLVIDAFSSGDDMVGNRIGQGRPGA